MESFKNLVMCGLALLTLLIVSGYSRLFILGIDTVIFFVRVLGQISYQTL